MPPLPQPDQLRPGAELASTVLEAETRSTQALRIGLLIAGGMCSLPFLLPYNRIFLEEWLAGALGVAAAIAVLTMRDVSVVSLPSPARWLVAFALFLGVQSFIVHPVYTQTPVLATLYVLYALLLIWLGAQLAASNGLERAATILATCLLAGAVANAAAGMIQFYGRPTLLEDIVADLPYGAGAWGNISQQNLYANYLALGGAALLFLWHRGNLRTAHALAAAILLAWASALSGSRSSMMYALWFALIGILGGRLQSGIEGRRLKFAALTLAATMLVAHIAIPWLNGAFALDTTAKGALERATRTSLEGEPRWQAWLLAWRIFSDAPIVGVGIGGFAGALFRSGLPPSLTQFGNQVWTSPHNLPVQLLAETGALGTLLALACPGVWWWQTVRRYVTNAQPALWWIIAATGIEFIHSIFEYPLWSAHFLGVTALLIGLGAQPHSAARAKAHVTRTAAATACAVLALALALLLKDYVRLSSTQVTGAAITLQTRADAARDAAELRAVTRGLLAAPAEYWTILGTALDRSQLPERLEVSGRIARHYPAHAILVRRAVFLAFDGQGDEAHRLLAQVMYTFPKRCGETIRILGQALTSDPGAIEPLLNLAKDARRADCS